MRNEIDVKREGTEERVDPVQRAIDRGEYVCPLLGRACLEEDCAWYLSDSVYKDDWCAVLHLAMSHKSVQVSTRNIASCM